MALKSCLWHLLIKNSDFLKSTMTVSFKKMIDTKRREDDSWNFGQIHLSVKEIRPVQK